MVYNTEQEENVNVEAFTRLAKGLTLTLNTIDHKMKFDHIRLVIESTLILIGKNLSRHKIF